MALAIFWLIHMVLQAQYLKLFSIVTSFHLTCIEVKQTEFLKQQFHMMQAPWEQKLGH